MYEIGDALLHRSWPELNNRSVIDDENQGQMLFNANVDESFEDPDEAWKWRGTRSKARNKGVAMHAQLTAAFLLPVFNAQNENDETDRDFSEVMRDLVEWMADPTNSNYQSSYLSVTMGMLTNPVTYLGAEYTEVYQKIKEKKEKGYSTKEVLDSVLSGFNAPVYSSSQVLITNAYERDIQKQANIIKRKWIEYSEAEAKYGEHDNWSSVKKGTSVFYNSEDGLFYEIFDDQHPNLVEETTFLGRREDTEVCFLGGVYMGDTDVEANPIRHRDNFGAPKYNVVPFGYGRIGQHFFYYKSLMNCLGWENALLDAQTEVVMNRAMLEMDSPTLVTGIDGLDTSVVFPGSLLTSENENAKVQPLLPQANFYAGFEAMRKTEESMTEASVSETMQGQLPDATQKAFTVAKANENSKILIKGVGRTLGESMLKYGLLMADIAINHLTVAQVDDLVGTGLKMKYKSFLLENRSINGKTLNKKIKFDQNLVGAEMSPKDQKNYGLKLLGDSGYPNHKEAIYLINPELFAKMKYLSKIDLEEMFPRNSEYWTPILMQLKTLLAQDPTIKQDELTRRLMHAVFRSEGDSLVQTPQPNPIQIPSTPMGQQGLQNGIKTVMQGATS